MPFDLPDLSSFASSLLPAVAGGLTGGPAGAAYGLAAGLAGADDARFKREKENRDIMFGNIQANQAQERIGLQREQQAEAATMGAATRTHYEALNAGVYDGLKTADLNRQKEKFALDNAMRDDKALQDYFAKRPDMNEADKRLLKENPTAFSENKFHDDLAVQTMAGVLKTYKMQLQPGQTHRDVAVAMGPKVTHQFILNEQKAQQEMQQIAAQGRVAGMNRWEVVPTPDGIYAFNRQNRSMELIKSNVGSKPEQRVKADVAMRQQFKEDKANNPRMIGMEYEDYTADPVNQTTLAYNGGMINAEQYESGMKNARQQKQDQELAAKSKMFGRWAKANGLDAGVGQDAQGEPVITNPTTRERWERYWTEEKTAEGAMGIYNQYLKVERKDKGWKTTPPQAREPAETRREGGGAWLNQLPPANSVKPGQRAETSDGRIVESDGKAWVPARR